MGGLRVGEGEGLKYSTVVRVFVVLGSESSADIFRENPCRRRTTMVGGDWETDETAQKWPKFQRSRGRIHSILPNDF